MTTPTDNQTAETKTDAHGFTRNRRGAFAKGTRGGPGRLPRISNDEYLKLTFDSCTPEDWRKIVKRAVKDAIEGNWRARDFLAKYLLPAQARITFAPTVAVGFGAPMPPPEQVEQALMERLQHLIAQRNGVIDAEAAQAQPERKDSDAAKFE